MHPLHLHPNQGRCTLGAVARQPAAEEYATLAVDQFALESVCIASRSQSFSPLADLVTELSKRGLQCAVHHFPGPEGEDEDDQMILVSGIEWPSHVP